MDQQLSMDSATGRTEAYSKKKVIALLLQGNYNGAMYHYPEFVC